LVFGVVGGYALMRQREEWQKAGNMEPGAGVECEGSLPRREPR